MECARSLSVLVRVVSEVELFPVERKRSAWTVAATVSERASEMRPRSMVDSVR